MSQGQTCEDIATAIAACNLTIAELDAGIEACQQAANELQMKIIALEATKTEKALVLADLLEQYSQQGCGQ